MDGVQNTDDVRTLVGEERGYLSLRGVLIPPLDGMMIGDWFTRWRGGQPALSTLTLKVPWQALVPHVLGSLSAWILNEFGIGIAPLNGNVVPLVLAWWLSARARR